MTDHKAHSVSQFFVSMSSHFPLPSLASAHLTGEDTEAENSDRVSPGPHDQDEAASLCSSHPFMSLLTCSAHRQKGLFTIISPVLSRVSRM